MSAATSLDEDALDALRAARADQGTAPNAAAAGEEATDLWLALTALPRPHRIVPLPRCFPGTDQPVGDVALWPLTQEEQMAANAEADRWTKRLMKEAQSKAETNLGYMHTYTNEVAIQVLWRASRVPNDLKRRAFPSPGGMRKELTTDEIGVLFQNYCTMQLELGPIDATMTPEEREGLILRIQQDGSAYPFDSLSWDKQRTLVSFMASQLVSCWTAMSSAGLPLDVFSGTEAEVRRAAGLPPIGTPAANDMPEPSPEESPPES